MQDFIQPYNEEIIKEFKIIIPKLLAGEKIYNIIQAKYNDKLEIHLMITNYRMQIIAEDNNMISQSMAEIPLGCIDQIELLSPSLTINCKDFRLIKFTECKNLDEFVKILNMFRNLPFVLHREENTNQKGSKGESFYDLEKEFLRQKIPQDQWKITNLNHDYSLCPTYPKKLIVPFKIMDEELISVSKFRSSKRIPTLVYYHVNSGASLSRCSQPKVGIFWSRSQDDENLIKYTREANQSNQSLQIIDCRAKIAALGNNLKGAGTENINNYQNCELKFMDIGNIHTMRASLSCLFDLIKKETNTNSYGSWLYGLSKTGWLDHIHQLIISTTKITEMIDKQKESVIIHCSDGWDRTPQLCALVQVLLDPYYRTMEGFAVLVEKEWNSFGHKYSDRSNFCKTGFWTEHESSPIFLQFLDCVFQFYSQFQSAFEFNELYLITIMNHFYSNRFSNFLGNNEREREEIFTKRNVDSYSTSLWKYFRSSKRRFNFVNHLYNKEDTQVVLYPKSNQMLLNFWKSYYLRYFISEFDILIDRPIVSKIEPLIFSKISKIEMEKDNIKTFFNFKTDEVRKTFIGTKVSVREGSNNVVLDENYETSDSDVIPLIPFPIIYNDDDSFDKDNLEGYMQYFSNGVYNGFNFLYKNVHGWLLKQESK
eukprot:TRINITY_DN678_c0_g1_i1.p1 TRINITY_DN678_c0_g1~~TRINITY_DN678_c0_g1_i1.p1  ORF type:complete len:652 (-),score=155.56 TRINITY_DN678_c0_g1_i1:85-2040(-)